MKNRLRNADFFRLINVGQVIAKENPVNFLSVVADSKDSDMNFNIFGLGIKNCNQLIAYVLFSIENESSEIHSIAVDPFFRSMGFGKALLCGALTYSLNKGCKTCLLRVKVSNIAAIALYEKQNFFVGRTLKDYYNKPTEDGLEMLCYLE